ncbi:MAG: HIT family protein [Acidimicrobiales bacterium]
MSSLDHLWAGWRSGFVAASTGAPDGSGRGPCLFCNILASGLADEEARIVWRHPAGRVVAMLNAYPYASGHVLAMPVRHVAEVEDLSSEEAADLWQAVTSAVRALKAAYGPDGVNMGANLGRAAGAGVPGHFHMHVLPRWVGDSNFMTAVADARVLPEPLSESASKLRKAWPD